MACYGETSTVELAVIRCLWYGSLGKLPVHVVLVRELDSSRVYDIALVTTGLAATPEQIVARYAARWPAGEHRPIDRQPPAQHGFGLFGGEGVDPYVGRLGRYRGAGRGVDHAYAA